MTLPSRDRPPRSLPPPGLRWVFREGCTCERCPWREDGGRCLGKSTSHWTQVPDHSQDAGLPADH